MMIKYFLFFIVIALTGCAPSRQLHVHWQATRYVNPGPKHQELSVEAKLYQLTAMQPFLALSANDLSAISANQSMATNIISTHDLWLAPGVRGTQNFRLKKHTRYIAVFVNFNKLCDQEWRAWVSIPNHWSFQSLDLNVRVSNCHVYLHFKPTVFE